MDIANQLLFFLAGLGVFNGILLAAYFIFGIKPRRWVNILFGLLMLMLCIRIGKSLFHVFTDVARIYRQIGLSACMMIGPFLYLYVHRFLAENKKPSLLDALHLSIPMLTIVTIGLVRPYEQFPKFWNEVVVLLIYAVWTIYMIVASVRLLPLFKKLVSKEITIAERWILLVHSCVSVICIAYISAYYGFPYLSGPLLFSVVFYVLTGYLVKSKHRMAIFYTEPIKYQNQKVSAAMADDLLRRLEELMLTDKAYLDNKVKLAAIAKSIEAKPHVLSQVINDRLGISFNHYINEFRINAACKMLRESNHLTIEGIGREVGFKSKTSFYAAFKAKMNQTPAQYKSQFQISTMESGS